MLPVRARGTPSSLSSALPDGSLGVSVREEDDRAVVTVSDTGVGIPAHEMRRLFERFHRISGVRARSHEDSGIGLAHTAR